MISRKKIAELWLRRPDSTSVTKKKNSGSNLTPPQHHYPIKPSLLPDVSFKSHWRTTITHSNRVFVVTLRSRVTRLFDSTSVPYFFRRQENSRTKFILHTYRTLMRILSGFVPKFYHARLHGSWICAPPLTPAFLHHNNSWRKKYGILKT